MSSRTRESTSQGQNLLLASLPGDERRQLVARCEPVELTLGEMLFKQGDRIRHVYFPTSSFVSLITSMDDRPALEVGLVGSEGMLGVAAALGVNLAPFGAVVQGAGAALRMDVKQFSRELTRSPVLRKEVNCYVYVLLNDLGQAAACTHFHRVEARLARWLLMTRDRAHSDSFQLTQAFMAYMLGVRRAGITDAAGSLQKRNLIRYTRGNVLIRDRKGLEAVSCACYAAARDTYARVIG